MSLRPILVFYVRLTLFVLMVECTTFWAWSRWIWTPVQAHYMAAYVWTYLPGKASDSEFKIRWISKTRPGGKRELAIEDDAVRVSSSEHGRTGMDLSQTAREAGWTSLLESPPEGITAARLRAILADQIFEGQSVWVFILMPAMIGFAAAIFSLQCLIWLDDWLPELPWRRERFPWERPALNIFERCTEWVAKIPSLVARLRRADLQQNTIPAAVRTTKGAETELSVRPPVIAFPPLGVPDTSGARVYLWSERDEIE